MKQFLPILVWLLPYLAAGQAIDSIAKTTSGNKPASTKPEILSGGFIDIVQNGQMNASARLFRLFIGEPGKFQLPVSVYTGVSANNFSNNRPTDDMVLILINPGAGIFNMSFDGSNRIFGKQKKLTSLQIQYQAGLRFLSVFNRLTYTNSNFPNLISGLGFTLVTGAWERNKTNNLGFFWLNLRALYSNNPPTVLKDFFSKPIRHEIFGYSIGMGIEISQTMNVRVFYFHFLNNREIESFTQPLLQLTFNYTMR